MGQPGHNNPPEPTPLETAREVLADLTLEANNWIDGQDIANAEQAKAVAKLMDDARKAKTRFDNERKAEKAPHDQAAKAVDAAWKPVIADADRIVEVSKAAQTVWLIKQDEEKRALEAATRKVAEEAAAEAKRLAEQSDGSLAAAKARDAAIEEAKRCEQVAHLAATAKAGAKGEGMTRAVSLRTTWRAEVKDRRALLNHIAKNHPDDLSAFLDDWAARAVRNGNHELPGVEAWAEKAAA
jgi:hypothetical protein